MRPASSFRPQTRDTARVKFTRVKFKRQLEPPMQIAAATGISGGDCVVLQATAANDSESNVRATVWEQIRAMRLNGRSLRCPSVRVSRQSREFMVSCSHAGSLGG